MRKVTIQGIGIIAIFFFTWFALSEIDWLSLLKVEKWTKKTEEKLGDLFWDVFNKSEKEIKDKEITIPLDSILSRICESNGFEKSGFKFHILKSDEINAFALPDQHLVIFTGLFLDSENESELAGIICHEIAHMRSNHVMKKLIKEIGLSALISISTGSSGSEIAKETARLLSSSAYDRKLEKEADIMAADFLINSSISPEYFANFLLRLSESESEVVSHLSWISTHPDSKERAEYIMEYRKGEPNVKKEIITRVSWDNFKNKIGEL